MERERGKQSWQALSCSCNILDMDAGSGFVIVCVTLDRSQQSCFLLSKTFNTTQMTTSKNLNGLHVFLPFFFF